jgi:RimJ/RimL family protein N-acetyltransferase
LRALTQADCEQVRLWRNQNLQYLRTPYLLTEEMQAGFYDNTVCNRYVNSRWWGIHNGKLIGMAGLTDIAWENGTAEISLILNPKETGKGHGEAAVNLLLEQAFAFMGLRNIYGECYECNPAAGFWRKMIPAHTAMLPQRKLWRGKYYDSLYFSFMRGEVC